MAQVQSGEDSEGIKLFGTKITLHGRERSTNEEKIKDSEDDGKEENKRVDNKILPCPRCKSMETKFCYFNNYNVNQPRHFCKGCHRYWTAGGALRNVPVGAGRRKAKLQCRVSSEFLNSDLYDASTVQQFGLKLDDWRVVAVDRNDCQQLFQSKRQRATTSGQPY